MKYLLLISLIALAGCGGSPVGSSSVTSANLFANLKAVSAGTGEVEVFAELQNNNGSSVYLESGDRLVATDFGAPKQIVTTNNLFGGTAEFAKYVVEMELMFGSPIYYYGRFQSTGNKPIYISLFRGNENNFHDSSVTLPTDFAVTYPVAGTSVSRATNIPLTWSNAGDASEVWLDTSAICPGSARVQFTKSLGTDSGSAVVAATDYLPAGGTATCALTLTLSKIKLGTVDSGLGGGGLIQGVQQRSVTVNSVM